MTILSKNNQQGRSMIEMLGVLAIIGVLSVGGISGYSKAMAKFKLTKAQDQISMLLMNIRTAFATSPSYDGLNTEAARNYNIAPGDMFGAGTQLNNAFGGQAYVYNCNSVPTGVSGSPAACIGDAANNVQYFAISLTDLGREACVSLASSDWGTDGLIGMVVSGGSGGTNYAKDLPLKVVGNGTDAAGYQCGGKGVYNTITWIYY